MAKKDKFTAEDDELLAALGVEVEEKKKTTYSYRRACYCRF